ncbi:hypothetical protein TCAP_02324 [Tolypocladium capitatum]|uniref:Uncharacterized protein n=1 Tax=Tolypocladium capitatum TaxID=45235 RepID=A0A2K3QJM1_9HYPO|nr:hypothetical protein TCAP_02324 [Tolypocladium capitatum]
MAGQTYFGESRGPQPPLPLTLTLNPIERNARRGYTYVAMLRRSLVARYASTGDFLTLLWRWPMLGGFIFDSTKGYSRNVALVYPQLQDVELRPDIIQFCKVEATREGLGDLDERFFASDEREAAEGMGVPVVTMKTTFTRRGMIMGFAFHTIMFDSFSTSQGIPRGLVAPDVGVAGSGGGPARAPHVDAWNAAAGSRVPIHLCSIPRPSYLVRLVDELQFAAPHGLPHTPVQ